MKTLEDLSEAEKYALDSYNDAYRLHDTLWKIGKKIHESLQPEKWKPTVGKWIMGSRKAILNFSVSSVGYESREEAQRVLDLRKPLELLNRRIREENERTDFDEPVGAIIFYCEHRKTYVYEVFSTWKVLGHEPCNTYSAKIICKELNDGVIEL